jgi:hypothetical protein
MKIKNLCGLKVGDRVQLMHQFGQGPWTIVTVEEVKSASKTDWCFPNQVCVWWNGSQRWPISLCRKVEE